MPKVEAPFVGGELNTKKPIDSAMSIAFAVGGVALMTVILAYGSDLGNRLGGFVGGLLGTDVGQNGGGIAIDGDL